MKKVLITGGCGYLGGRLSQYLAENEYSVTVFDGFDPSEYNQWTSLMEEIIVGDIRDEIKVSKLVEKDFDTVIHLISLDHRRSENNPDFVSSINVIPTWNLLDKFSRKGLKKFIYFSTIQVYGKIPHKIITEKYSPFPINTYGLTHLLSENICNYFNRKTDTTCINIRLSNSYGSPVFKENNCWWLVVNDLCKMAIKQNKIQLLSNGLPQKDFIHVSDVCRAVDVLITSNNFLKRRDNVLHIASGNTLAILELAYKVKEVFKKRYQKEIPVILPNDYISEEPDEYTKGEKFVINTLKMGHLGFCPTTDLITGIEEVFTYLENHNANKQRNLKKYNSF